MQSHSTAKRAAGTVVALGVGALVGVVAGGSVGFWIVVAVTLATALYWVALSEPVAKRRPRVLRASEYQRLQVSQAPTRGPALRLDVDPHRPFDKRAHVAGFGAGCVPQVKVENIGDAVASQVRGLLVEWKYKGHDGRFRDHPNFGATRPLGKAPPSDIPPGRSTRLDALFTLKPDDDEREILALYAVEGPEGTDLLDGGHAMFPAGVYRAKVRVESDNAAPAEGVFDLDLEAWDQMRFYPADVP